MINLSIGDKVIFNLDYIDSFKQETTGVSKELDKYQEIVLNGINEIGTLKSIGNELSYVLFGDGWELPIPTKYLKLIP